MNTVINISLYPLADNRNLRNTRGQGKLTALLSAAPCLLVTR